MCENQMKCICGYKMSALDRSTYSYSNVLGKYKCPDCDWCMTWDRKEKLARWHLKNNLFDIDLCSMSPSFPRSKRFELKIDDNIHVIEAFTEQIHCKDIREATNVFNTEYGQKVLNYIDKILKLKVFL